MSLSNLTFHFEILLLTECLRWLFLPKYESYIVQSAPQNLFFFHDINLSVCWGFF